MIASKYSDTKHLAVPHTGIYKHGLSPSSWPRAYLPNVPSSLLSKLSKKGKEMCNINQLTINRDCKDIPKQKLVGGRNRIQVGKTNRWRLSINTGSDLLATTQVMRATYVGNKCDEVYYTCNPSSVKICESTRFVSSSSLDKYHVNKPNLSMIDDCGSQKWNGFNISKQRLNASNFYYSKHDYLLPLEREVAEMKMYDNYVPLEKRIPTPHEIFLKVSQEYHLSYGAGIVLHALDMEWELCQDGIGGSEVLTNLLNSPKSRETLTRFNVNVQGTRNENHVALDCRQSKKSDDCNERMIIKLSINNPLVSYEVLSVALLSLYKEIRSIPSEDVVNVLVAAQLLKIPRLTKVCSEVMLDSLKINTVCVYHNVCEQYGLEDVTKACVSWLELYLMSVLSSEIYLGHMTDKVLMQVLKSPRFFTFTEYSVFRMLCCWVFLKEQNQLLMPAWTTVVTWFRSISKPKPFLLTREGKCYQPLFQLLRLNGITDLPCVQEMKKMNILPPQWLLTALENHYYSIQNGGDMNLMTRFENGSIRYGFVLRKNVASHSEIISLHGFYFELTGVRDDGVCTCYLKRLRPNNSMLSFRICERQTFSMRQDREVRYFVKLQWKNIHGYRMETLGPASQVFMFGEDTSDGKKLCVKTPNTDLFISFALLFPPS